MNYSEAVKQIGAVLEQLPENDQYRVVQNLIIASQTASVKGEQSEFDKRREHWRAMNAAGKPKS